MYTLSTSLNYSFFKDHEMVQCFNYKNKLITFDSLKKGYIVKHDKNHPEEPGHKHDSMKWNENVKTGLMTTLTKDKLKWINEDYD